MADEDDELAARLAFVEGLEGDLIAGLVLDLQFAGLLECLRIVDGIVVLRLLCSVGTSPVGGSRAVGVLLRGFCGRGHRCVVGFLALVVKEDRGFLE